MKPVIVGTPIHLLNEISAKDFFRQDIINPRGGITFSGQIRNLQHGLFFQVNVENKTISDNYPIICLLVTSTIFQVSHLDKTEYTRALVEELIYAAYDNGLKKFDYHFRGTPLTNYLPPEQQFLAKETERIYQHIISVLP
jgi:hypothetical protein